MKNTTKEIWVIFEPNGEYKITDYLRNPIKYCELCYHEDVVLKKGYGYKAVLENMDDFNLEPHITIGMWPSDSINKI